MPLFKNSKVKIKPRRKIYHTSTSQEPEAQPISYKTLYQTLKQCPELVGTIMPLVMDILSDGYKLLGSKNKVKRMQKQLIAMDFTTKTKNFLIHAFLTGDGYMEYPHMIKKEFDGIVNKSIKKISKEIILKKGFRNHLRSKTYHKIFTKQLIREISEDLVLPFDLFNIKSDNMYKKIDVNGNVIGYEQKIEGRNIPVKFSKENIIHWSPFDLGEVYGFAPLESALNDTATLIFAKEYAGQFFENGGHIDRMYILPKSRGLNDRNYEVLKHEIKESQKKKKWHKSIVLTGDVKTETLNTFNKDLEFPELINQMTRRLLMAYGVPPTKTPLGGASKGDAREMNENYWKQVNYYQTEIENLFNKLIFSRHGVQIVYNRTYKIDELREAQIIGILIDRGLITIDEARNRIGYYEGLPKEKQEETKKPDRELPHRDLGDRQDARGLGNDTGARLSSFKTKTGMTMKVNFSDFKKIVEATGIPFQNAKIFFEETVTTYILWFSDGIFTYKCEVEKRDFDSALLINAIRLVGGVSVSSDEDMNPFSPLFIDHSRGD